ncbi:MAG: type pilus assembly protein PilC [Patescibacteria group bacterium]|nr:type II secretion system F family protein [Candidatus Saccharibacteria bacterium]MDQ5963223.1 type pilus assembly protein PilC [Patescibacteria group bacterium]
MAIYTYKALKKDGSAVEGTIEASDRKAALTSLHQQGVHPLVVGEQSKLNGGLNIALFNKVPSADMVVFTRQLSTMISAGVPLARGLTTLKDTPTSKYFQEVLSKVCKDIESGTSLADAFAKFPNVFDDVYVNMVKAGEEGGILDDILKRLATQVELNASIKKKVKSAMTYPVVILSLTIGAFFGIMFILMPKIKKILFDLGGPEAKLPVYTQALIDASEFSRKYALILIPAMVIITWAILHYIRTPKGKYQYHALMLRAPIVKVIITKVAIARFSRTFASLMSAGVGVLDALEVTGGAIGNKVIEKELAFAAEQVKNGRQLSDVIAESKHFPKIVSQMLAVGEETGTTDTVLIKVADFYEEEVANAIDSLASIIEPVMIVFLGSGVGLIAASVMGPIASMGNNVSAD